jgi:aminopeptidase
MGVSKFLCMDQLRLERWAALLCDFCFEIKAGQSLAVQSSTVALPLVRALHNALVARGAHPVLRLSYPGQRADFHRFATDDLLDHAAPADLAALERVDAFLRIESEDGSGLAGVDPARLIRERKMLGQHGAARAGKRWCITLYPSSELATQADMTEREFTEFVANAMFLDRADPVSGWLEVRALQAGLIQKLEGARMIRLETARTDLTLEATGRTWRNSDGQRNMPSGEIFTSPLETSANGTVFFDVPTRVNGQDVSGVELTLEDGVVTRATAQQGEAYLLAALETDAGARRLGEIGIGTNAGIGRATRNILFDEKIGGTAHLALGSSYAECGGLNKSALHWDLILDLRTGGRISVDGKPFSQDGRFV